MEEKEFNTTFAIPANYTDSGKIFGGMLEPRNAVEALILILAVGYPELMLIPMATTIRIVVMTVTLIPIGILAAMGALTAIRCSSMQVTLSAFWHTEENCI